MPTTVDTRRVRLAAASVFAVFLLSGATFASWASRLPAVRDALELAPDQMGVILFVGACGSLLSLPLTGRVIGAIGARRTVLAASGLAVVGMGLAVYGVTLGAPVLVSVGLFASMMGFCVWDTCLAVACTQY